jgi:hypothetical protein
MINGIKAAILQKIESIAVQIKWNKPTMNKQVKQMNKWKQVLLLGAGIFFSSASFAQETHSVTLQWDAVEHADSYRLEEKVDGSSWDSAIVTDTSDTSATLTERAEGDYVYRVIGCVTHPLDGLLCSEDIATYSVDYPVTLSAGDNVRRVIFIHTDLLGSPAAETNKDGVSQ